MTKKRKYASVKLMPRINSFGFTLVEVITAITVLAIASVVVVPNLRRYVQSQDLIVAKNDLKYALRTAQTNASSRVKCPTSDIASKSWSVVFTTANPPSYKLEARCSDDTIYIGPSKELSNVSLYTYCTESTVPLKFIKSDIEYPSLPSYNCTELFTVKLTSTFSNEEVCIKVDKGGAINEVTCP